MLRNNHEQKLKYFIRLRKYRNTLEDRKLEYVPVERPEHIGWNLQVVLSESGARRSDAPDLQYILNFVGASRKTFVRNYKIIRYLRRLKYKFIEFSTGVVDYKTALEKNFHIKGLFSYEISNSVYNNLPARVKKYFSEDIHNIYSYRYGRFHYVGKDSRMYKLNHNFPTYELQVKVTKAYSAFIGVPYADDISEDHRIASIFDRNVGLAVKAGAMCGRNVWKRDIQQRRAKRRSWNAYLSQIAKDHIRCEEEEFKLLSKTKALKRFNLTK